MDEIKDLNEQIHLTLHIDHARQGEYFTLPFSVPNNVESMKIIYNYQRYDGSVKEMTKCTYTSQEQINIIDIGLIAPDGSQVGASGSDKTEFTISATHATPGYTPHPLIPGEWSILVGAYKVAPAGVEINYTISYQHKTLQLLKGDLHAHTLASDGVHTAEELAIKAMRNGLDFVAITDHNQMVSWEALPKFPGITLIPGVEWTHYQGHANFLGVEKPYNRPFATHSDAEMRGIFAEAHQRGALISINHPFESGCEFIFDLKSFHFDCLEVWNGPMRESNLRAIGLWQHLLVSGMRIPACGGSDYHRDTPFIFLGGPTMGVISMSASVTDILDAVKKGHSFITFAPNGPTLEMHSGEAMMGDTVNWAEDLMVEISVNGLVKGDVVRMISSESTSPILEAPCNGQLSVTLPIEKPGFMRIEILRAFLPGLPLLPALISNPIYFES
jgi:hypothetical protein